jgi:FMN phosphatase YigB (HAD superfamily)
MMSLSQLAAVELQTFDLVSVDVFDTILLRDLSSQMERFAEISLRVSEAMGRGDQPDTLLRLRLSLHGLAYRAVSIERPMSDVKLTDIHRLEARLLCGDPTLAGPLHEAEMAVDRSRLTANKPLLTLLDRFAASSKRIVATSDTYYATSDVERLLECIAGGHPIARVYSSCDLGLTKHAGGLFAEIARREGVEISRILHFGDDLRADVHMARAAGCQAVHLPRSAATRLARKMFAALFLASHPHMIGQGG